jgi:hypothetical protein
MSILGAMSTRGMIATMTNEEATDTDIFLAYIWIMSCVCNFGLATCGDG